MYTEIEGICILAEEGSLLFSYYVAQYRFGVNHINFLDVPKIFFLQNLTKMRLSIESESTGIAVRSRTL